MQAPQVLPSHVGLQIDHHNGTHRLGDDQLLPVLFLTTPHLHAFDKALLRRFCNEGSAARHNFACLCQCIGTHSLQRCDSGEGGREGHRQVCFGRKETRGTVWSTGIVICCLCQCIAAHSLLFVPALVARVRHAQQWWKTSLPGREICVGAGVRGGTWGQGGGLWSHKAHPHTGDLSGEGFGTPQPACGHGLVEVPANVLPPVLGQVWLLVSDIIEPRLPWRKSTSTSLVKQVMLVLCSQCDYCSCTVWRLKSCVSQHGPY